VRDGVVDMVYTPGSFYGGTLPEKDALVASNLTAIEARENGGIDLINDPSGEDGRLISRLVRQRRHLQSLDGQRAKCRRRRQSGDRRYPLRGNAVYNAFFTDYLGAQVIDLPTGDVYSALERGTVDATGLDPDRLDRSALERVPQLPHRAQLLLHRSWRDRQSRKWNSLSEEARKILQDVAIEHERMSVEALRAKRDEDFAALEEGGMKVFSLEGEARAATWKPPAPPPGTGCGLDGRKPPGCTAIRRSLIELFYDPAMD
jgi:hypothetical protein